MLISHLVKFLHRMFENSGNEKLVNQLGNFYDVFWSENVWCVKFMAPYDGDGDDGLKKPENDGLGRGKDDGDQPGPHHHQSEREIGPEPELREGYLHWFVQPSRMLSIQQTNKSSEVSFSILSRR